MSLMDFTQDDKGYFKRGRCSNWYVNKVGENSTCGCCKMVSDKHRELYKALFYFTNGSKFNEDDWEVLNPRNVNKSENYNKLIKNKSHMFECDFPVECGEGESKERCFCTQTIQRLCYVRYIPLGDIVLIGSDCIEKFLGLEAKLKAEGKLCKMCNYDKIDRRNSFGKDGYCSENCKKILTHRICGDCLDFKIPRTEPGYKMRCVDCFAKAKSLNKEYIEIYKDVFNYRICEDCYEFKIPRLEPEHKMKCVSCFAKS
jgi:hypothetical protein